MAAGDILRESGLVVDEVTVKANEDIEKGEIIYNDGNGFLACPNTVVAEQFYMAQEAHDYSAKTSHSIRAVLFGKVTAQKIAGTALKEGQKVIVGSTAGELTLFTKGDMPSAYDETIIQSAIDKNARIVATVAADAGSSATTVDVWMGVK